VLGVFGGVCVLGVFGGWFEMRFLLRFPMDDGVDRPGL